jgi:hypothetical protein
MPTSQPSSNPTQFPPTPAPTRQKYTIIVFNITYVFENIQGNISEAGQLLIKKLLTLYTDIPLTNTDYVRDYKVNVTSQIQFRRLESSTEPPLTAVVTTSFVNLVNYPKYRPSPALLYKLFKEKLDPAFLNPNFYQATLRRNATMLGIKELINAGTVVVGYSVIQYILPIPLDNYNNQKNDLSLTFIIPIVVGAFIVAGLLYSFLPHLYKKIKKYFLKRVNIQNKKKETEIVLAPLMKEEAKVEPLPNPSRVSFMIPNQESNINNTNNDSAYYSIHNNLNNNSNKYNESNNNMNQQARNFNSNFYNNFNNIKKQEQYRAKDTGLDFVSIVIAQKEEENEATGEAEEGETYYDGEIVSV